MNSILPTHKDAARNLGRFILPDENDQVGVRLEAELAEPFDTVLTNAKRPAGDPGEPLDSSSIHSVARTQSICLSNDTVVERRGLEPLTSTLQRSHSTN